MSTSTEKTSWRWQLEQLQQQFGEWIEVKLRSDDRDAYEYFRSQKSRIYLQKGANVYPDITRR